MFYIGHFNSSIWYLNHLYFQIDALKFELEQFFGKDPMNSKDISRIVSSTQFTRLAKLLEEDKVSDKIVLGGQMDENQL